MDHITEEHYREMAEWSALQPEMQVFISINATLVRGIDVLTNDERLYLNGIANRVSRNLESLYEKKDNAK